MTSPSKRQEIRKRAEEAKARAEKATPGPWAIDIRAIEQHMDWIDGKTAYLPGCRRVVEDGFACSQDDEPRGVLEDDDAEFIAHARTDVPSLADDVLSLLHWIEYYESMAEKAYETRDIALRERDVADGTIVKLVDAAQSVVDAEMAWQDVSPIAGLIGQLKAAIARAAE